MCGWKAPNRRRAERSSRRSDVEEALPSLARRVQLQEFRADGGVAQAGSDGELLEKVCDLAGRLIQLARTAVWDEKEGGTMTFAPARTCRKRPGRRPPGEGWRHC